MGVKNTGSQDSSNALPLQDFSLASAETKTVRDLGSLAEIELIQGGGDTITSAEKSSLLSTAGMLIGDPTLPQGDKDLLNAWLAKVETINTVAPNLEISGATNADVRALGQAAEAVLTASSASGGPASLTMPQIQSFIDQAYALTCLPDVSADDKIRLAAWIGQVASFAPILPPTVDNTPSSVGVNTLARHNPYEDPSLMAIIGPMMNELAKAMNMQILSSATMAVLFMQVTLAMAQETAAAEVAKAYIDSQQQMQEAEANKAAALQARVQGALAIASPLASIGAQRVAMRREGVGFDRTKEPGVIINPDTKKPIPMETPGWKGTVLGRRSGENLTRDALGSGEFFRMRQETTQNTKAVVEGAFNAATQFMTAATETKKADIKETQAGLTLESGTLQAAISVLQALMNSMQKITDDMRSSGQEAKANFEKEQDFLRDVARTRLGGRA